MTYTSIDLFSGPGGICTGFKWAGIKPLIAVEWSDWTVKTYATTHNADIFPLEEYLNGSLVEPERFFEKNSKTLLIHGDINLVTHELIDKILRNRFGVESVDIVTGGAPCESFSMAGTRTIGDERDNLFLNILRIARHVKSKMILFENVKGLLSKEKGEIFQHICDEFERIDDITGIGYRLSSRDPQQILLRASDYGVPQNRERIFLVGVRHDLNANFSYPEPTHGPDRKYPYITVQDALMDLPLIEAGQESDSYNNSSELSLEEHVLKFLNKMRGQEKGFEPPEHLKFTSTQISSHKAVAHREKIIKRMELIKQGESMKTAAERLIAEGREDLRNLYFPKKLYGARNRRLRLDQPSFTVTSHCLDEMIHPLLNRGLTPREAARLQSFPDWYQFEGPYVKFHSDPEQDRYEQIGDAIPPLLAYALGIQVKKTLDNVNNTKINSEENSIVNLSR
jgi:DNA (cytosine-5)-methyltransferase 1